MAGIKSGYCLLYGAVVPLPTQVPISLKMAGSLAWIALWYISSMFVVSTAAVAVDKDAMAPIVDLGYAQYQGYFDAPMNITNFLGIRYAAPPVGQCSTRLRLIVAMTDSRVGNLRFRAPQTPDVESGVQPATKNPTKCYQTGPGRNMSPLVTPHGHGKRQRKKSAASEDCLFLK